MAQINIKGSGPEVLNQRILVDLSQTDRDNVNVGTAIVIEATPHKSLKNFFGLDKKISRDLNILVDGLDIDNQLVVDTDLLSVYVDGAVSDLKPGNSVPVAVRGPETSFQLLFHPSAILDCMSRQGEGDNTFPISFRIVVTDENGVEICAQPVNLELELIPLDFRPEVKLRIPEKERKFSHRAGIVKIGKIEIRNLHTLRRLPPVGLSVALKASVSGRDVDESTVWIDGLPKHLCRYLNGHTRVEIDRLETAAGNGDNSLALDVMCDFNRIGNPCDEPDGKAEIELHLDVRYHNVLNPGAEDHLFVPDASFFVLKNVEQPELKVDLKEENGETRHLPAEGARTERLVEIRYLPSQKLMSRISLLLRNTAEEGPDGTGIYIRNISLSPALPQGAVFTPANRFASIDTLVHLESSMPELVYLPNKGVSRQNIEVIFDGSQVGELYMDKGHRGKDYLVPLQINLSFDYIVDEEGWSDGTDPNLWKSARHFQVKLIAPVFQRPNPEWLSIDFGTSAIVSMHAGRLLDLHSRKNALQHISPSSDSYEIGTEFLSSNVILRNMMGQEVAGSAPESQLMGEEGSTKTYEHLAVCLSPSSVVEAQNAYNALPCLKMMVGYGILPDIDNYSDFRYWCHPFPGEPLARVGMVAEDAPDEAQRLYSPLAYVDNVFSQVYQQFFRYYIEEVVKDGSRRINQLVLTVPNTYSPYHLERIRKIISENIKSLNVRNIRFVSESDAVACYYQAEWSAINDMLKRKNAAELAFDETVLVFDMGAGTLDLTLFRRERNRKTGIDEVSVKGKIGISKAGNYLDALIAELLGRHFQQFETISNPEKIKTGDDLRGAIALKNVIKNLVKPKLKKGEIITIGKNSDLGIRDSITIDVDAMILNTPEFKAFVKECTADLLKNFFNFFRVEKDFKVDTVLMSGRSAKLPAIKEALDKALPKYQANDAMIVEVKDLGSGSGDKSKTIVAEGAAYYCNLVGRTSKIKFETDNLSACYGVTYFDSTGLKYVELLNPRTAHPTSEKVREGIVVRTYKSDEVTLDLSYSMGADRPLTLIQTFHADPVKAIKKGQQEYITEIASFDPSTFDHRDATRLSLEVTPDGMMRFRINGKETPELSTTKIDVTSVTARRSFWPVIKR